ncbi:hypothetical protein LSCM1_07208 [Leishmania martiniquensis]|uniref:Uncharacterized protein n=1 Tax=Leishmania martiniquensis TaxID=1580590 RepID=A0A836KWT9_9TRYP|nr:hypothetical protein LSCM1_07208 [Leishmania martiniquensis]
MPHDRSRTSRVGDALVAHRPHDSLPPVERQTRVDPRTHARSVYQRGSDGSEMYACYYNSNEDPTFQERFNKRNNGNAFVQTAQFTYMSRGGAGSQGLGADSSAKEASRRPVVVEESGDADAYEVRSNSGDNADVEAGRKKTAHHPRAQGEPIVEEPDEYGGKRHRRSSRRNAMQSKYSPGASMLSMDPWGMESIMERMMQPPSASHGLHQQLQLAPYTRGGVVSSPFTGDFFGPGGLDSPFRMMDAMQHHMRQQRAAMFGGVDPFAHFF